MGRAERCPRCGSKKVKEELTAKKCGVCGFEWSGRIRRKTARKDKVRFR
ncbi:MAG: hypothetical protein JSV57_02655 [Candidatus Bathyarchaeota archaeon]|nr:MAG: hypothetical protein JSV57_02655 [Candidatus Bathyarchaeota archaeon]